MKIVVLEDDDFDFLVDVLEDAEEFEALRVLRGAPSLDLVEEEL